MEYRFEAGSVEGFVQLLAANYLPHGYWFYVTGSVPLGKDPRAVDGKLLMKYGVAVSRQARARRKQAGLANVHYLRHGRFWVLLATHGEHRFFSEEGERVRDVRRLPIQFEGYSLSVKRGHFLKKASPDEPAVPDTKLRVRVQIARDRYQTMKAYYLDLATHRSTDWFRNEFWRVPFEPYAPVRRQMLNLLRLVNDARKAAGYELIPTDVLRYRRRIVKPFHADIALTDLAPTMNGEPAAVSASYAPEGGVR
jgi:hypothetical protein